MKISSIFQVCPLYFHKAIIAPFSEYGALGDTSTRSIVSADNHVARGVSSFPTFFRNARALLVTPAMGFTTVAAVTIVEQIGTSQLSTCVQVGERLENVDKMN